jgi:hypothetical protein
MKKMIFCKIRVAEGFGADPHPDPHPDPLVKGTDPRIRIRIHTKMSRIRNTANYQIILIKPASRQLCLILFCSGFAPSG